MLLLRAATATARLGQAAGRAATSVSPQRPSPPALGRIGPPQHAGLRSSTIVAMGRRSAKIATRKVRV